MICSRPSRLRTPSKYPILNGVEYREGREICLVETAEGDRQYKSRTQQMVDRQDGLCAICGLWMVDITFDHEVPRGAGHQNDALTWPDGRWRNAAVDARCNTHKGSKRYGWTNNNTVYAAI